MGLLNRRKKPEPADEDRKELEKVKKRLTAVERRTTYLETQLKVIGRK